MITTITIFFPLIGTLLMLFLRSAEERTVRYAALSVAAVPLLLVLYIYFAHGGSLNDPSLTQSFDWIDSLASATGWGSTAWGLVCSSSRRC